jgi:hypothetical protein
MNVQEKLDDVYRYIMDNLDESESTEILMMIDDLQNKIDELF